LLEQLERSKLGATRRPRQTAGHEGSRKAPAAVPRHVPAAVKRAVWARDAGQCAFIGTDGRCPETGFLEFHHVAPFARGGPTTVANLQLRCRAHNAHQAELEFGRSRVGAVRSLACASCVI
jgi:5-methylcytosine-specific restriction endonuclease McrA